MSATKSDVELQAQAKDLDRSSRLSLKKFGEHKLRTEFKSIAIESCKSPMQAFGKCASDNGLMVVFNCRTLLNEMNACMAQYNSNEEFEKYMTKHRPDLLSSAKP